ncbi:MAG: TetR family transcriptional regulator C-terminal domain-containing protein [Rhizobiaceae bacterium]
MGSLEKGKQISKRTAPRDVRRRQLIMAAMDSISKRGFSDTTLKHVTEKAKLSHGVVNYHFDSKEALYDATLGLLAKEHYDLWIKYKEEAGPEPAKQLIAMVEADFDRKVCTPKRLAVWFAFWGQAKYRPNYLEIHSKYDNERHSEFTDLCSQIISDGKYSNLEAEQTARTIQALIDGFWLDLMLYPSEAKRSQTRYDCLWAISQIFPRHIEGGDFLDGSECQKTISDFF